MATSQVPTSKSATTHALMLRRFELMAAEHVARIGVRIRQRRDEVGLTQRELADLIPGKADSNQVSKWERGEHKPGDDTLEHIAKALKVDPSYFHIPEPGAGTPDLMQSLNGAGPSQLDRIEGKLEDILSLLRALDVRRQVEDALRRSQQQELAPKTPASKPKRTRRAS